LPTDSAVFAEEVEPTGAVPMELSLERYRRAALHPAPRPAPDARALPRYLLTHHITLLYFLFNSQIVLTNLLLKSQTTK
jgi:hypothetical protein